jgi:hypothetical protein
MKISKVGFLTISSPISSPRGQAPMRIGGLMSPTSPTCSRISSNPLSAGKRVLRASASFNGRTISASCATEEKRGLAFRRRKKDHYALLGVPCGVSYSDIRVAYRRLALKYHPDVMPLHQLETATDLFSEINEAYDTLSDPQKRKAYDDMLLIPSFNTARAAGSGHWRGRSWETDQCWCR